MLLLLLVGSAVIALLLAAAEAGFRKGRALRGRALEPDSSVVNSVQAAMLALFGLLLGFSLSMAESRFSQRRQMITTEANAIGTAWLRAGTLDAQTSIEARALLVRYATTRVTFYDAARDRARADQALEQGRMLQRQLWTHAEAAGTRSRDPVTGLFIAAVNDVIDRGTEREALLDDRVPFSLIVTVLLAALIGCGTTGLSTGLTRRRTVLSLILVPLMIGIGCVTLLDLDAPRAGLIRTGQTVMVQLRNDLQAQTPGVR